DESALGEVVGAGAEEPDRHPRRRVSEAPEAGPVESQVAAMVLEDGAGGGLRHPGAELNLADAATRTVNPDDGRFRHVGNSRGGAWGKKVTGPCHLGVRKLRQSAAAMPNH